MSYTVSDAKTDLNGILKGTSTNKITGLDNLLRRAARKVLSDLDPAETIRTAQIATPIYDKVYDYALPTDIKGDRIIDIYPQINRDAGDKVTHVGITEFGAYKSNGAFNVKYDDGNKTLRLSRLKGSHTTLHTMDSISSNGAWTVNTDGSNLTLDTLQKKSGSGSLRFDVDGSTGVAYLENSTMNSVDISASEDEGALFTYVYIPTTATVTNFVLRWGSDSSNFWTQTVTVQHDGTAFADGWNLLRFDWDDATQTSSPDASAVDYLRFTVNYTAGTASEGFRVDNITASKGEIYLIDYYSDALFRSTAGVWSDSVSGDTDIINLGVDSYNIFLDVAAEFCYQQITDNTASNDVSYFDNEYKIDIKRYKEKYPSQVRTQTHYYYKMRTNRRRVSRINN